MSDWQHWDVTGVWVVWVCERDRESSWAVLWKQKRWTQSSVTLHAIIFRVFSLLPEHLVDFRASPLFPFFSFTSLLCHTFCRCKQVYLVGHISVTAVALSIALCLKAVRQHVWGNTADATTSSDIKISKRKVAGRGNSLRMLSVHPSYIVGSFLLCHLHDLSFSILLFSKSCTTHIICKNDQSGSVSRSTMHWIAVFLG